MKKVAFALMFALGMPAGLAAQQVWDSTISERSPLAEVNTGSNENGPDSSSIDESRDKNNVGSDVRSTSQHPVPIKNRVGRRPGKPDSVTVSYNQLPTGSPASEFSKFGQPNQQAKLGQIGRYPLPSRTAADASLTTHREYPNRGSSQMITQFGSYQEPKPYSNDQFHQSSTEQNHLIQNERNRGYQRVEDSHRPISVYEPGSPTDGMSPLEWGTEPDSLDSDPAFFAGNISGPDTSWMRDPSAYEPGPSFYERERQRKMGKGQSLPEILNKGRYFGSIEAMVFEPSFQGSTALTKTNGSRIDATPFDFGLKTSPRIRFGFESERGPGVELCYWNFYHNSNRENFTSDGPTVGETAVYLLGPERWSRLATANAGDRLSVQHSMKVEAFDTLFSKEVEFPVSRLNGILGLTYGSVAHRLLAIVRDAGGSLTERMDGLSDFEGFGPTIGIEYARPVGHTDLELLGGLRVSLIFGERDQLVTNSSNLDFNRFRADELMSVLSAHMGIAYVKRMSERQSFFGKVVFEGQHWLGGGSPIDPTSDFGLYGLTFGAGLNR